MTPHFFYRKIRFNIEFLKSFESIWVYNCWFYDHNQNTSSLFERKISRERERKREETANNAVRFWMHSDISSLRSQLLPPAECCCSDAVSNPNNSLIYARLRLRLPQTGIPQRKPHKIHLTKRNDICISSEFCLFFLWCEMHIQAPSKFHWANFFSSKWKKIRFEVNRNRVTFSHRKPAEWRRESRYLLQKWKPAVMTQMPYFPLHFGRRSKCTGFNIHIAIINETPTNQWRSIIMNWIEIDVARATQIHVEMSANWSQSILNHSYLVSIFGPLIGQKNLSILSRHHSLTSIHLWTNNNYFSFEVRCFLKWNMIMETHYRIPLLSILTACSHIPSNNQLICSFELWMLSIQRHVNA